MFRNTKTLALGSMMLAPVLLAPPAIAQGGAAASAPSQPVIELHPMDLNADGLVDREDIAAFLIQFIRRNDAADMNEDGAWDYTDVLLFLDGYAVATAQRPVSQAAPVEPAQLLVRELRRAAAPGDFDADGQVTPADIARFLAAFGAGSPDADINADGDLDFSDVLELLRQYGSRPAGTVRPALHPRMADIDRNRVIDERDLAAFFIHLSMQSDRADLNADGAWDYTDVLLFLETLEQSLR